MLISLANMKGGVSKTTLAVNIAASIAHLEYSVNVLDLDPQQSACSFQIQNVEIKPMSPAHLTRYKPTTDYTLIDTPPTLGRELAAALKVSRYVIVPINSEYSALQGLKLLTDTITHARKTNPLLTPLYVLTMFDTRSGHCRFVEDELRRIFPTRVLQTVIHRSYVFADAALEHKSILEFRPRSKAAQQITELTQELLQWHATHKR